MRARLLARARGAYDSMAVGLGLQLLAHPLHFAMQRRQLLTLERRVEGFAAAERG